MRARRPIVILLVEDCEDLREMTRTVLERNGYAVRAAITAEEALEILEAIPTPRAIVTDLIMPGMGGGELIDRLRADPRFASIPIVVTSAVADRSPHERVVSLRKPVDTDSLLEAVGTLVRGQSRVEGLMSISRDVRSSGVRARPDVGSPPVEGAVTGAEALAGASPGREPIGSDPEVA